MSYNLDTIPEMEGTGLVPGETLMLVRNTATGKDRKVPAHRVAIRNANALRGADKVVEFLQPFPGMPSLASTLATLDPKTLCPEVVCTVQNDAGYAELVAGVPGKKKQLVVAIDVNGELTVMADAGLTSRTVKATWVAAGTVAAQLAGREYFTPFPARGDYPLGFEVKYVVQGKLRLFQAKKLLAVDSSDEFGIPAPTGLASDENWEELSPEGTTLPAEIIISADLARTLRDGGKIRPTQYRIERRVDVEGQTLRPVVVRGISASAFDLENALQQREDGSWEPGTYVLNEEGEGDFTARTSGGPGGPPAIPLAGTNANAPVTGQVEIVGGSLRLYDSANNYNIDVSAADGLNIIVSDKGTGAVISEYNFQGGGALNTAALLLTNVGGNGVLTYDPVQGLLINGVPVGAGGTGLTPEQEATINALYAPVRTVSSNSLISYDTLSEAADAGTEDCVVFLNRGIVQVTAPAVFGGGSLFGNGASVEGAPLAFNASARVFDTIFSAVAPAVTGSVTPFSRCRLLSGLYVSAGAEAMLQDSTILQGSVTVAGIVRLRPGVIDTDATYTLAGTGLVIDERGAGGGGTAGVSSVNTRTGDVTLSKADVGLNNVNNTADLNKPVSTATQAAITAAINGLINGAPGALDALNELAAAMGNDPNFATTVTNALAAKVASADVVNNLTTTVAGKVLDARQAKVLADRLTTAEQTLAASRDPYAIRDNSAVVTAVTAVGHLWTSGDLIAYGTSGQQTAGAPPAVSGAPSSVLVGTADVAPGDTFDAVDAAGNTYRYTYRRRNDGSLGWTRLMK